MFGMGPLELSIIVVILLVVFGAKWVPNLSRGLAQGIRNFRREVHNDFIREAIRVDAGLPTARNNEGIPSERTERATAH